MKTKRKKFTSFRPNSVQKYAIQSILIFLFSCVGKGSRALLYEPNWCYVFVFVSFFEFLIQFPASWMFKFEFSGPSCDHQVFRREVQHGCAMKCQIAHGNYILTKCERTERQIMTIDSMLEEKYSQTNGRYDRYIE